MVADFEADVGVDAVFALIAEGWHVGEGGVGVGNFVREGLIGHGCKVHGPCAGYGGHVVASASDRDPRNVEFFGKSGKFLNG